MDIGEFLYKRFLSWRHKKQDIPDSNAVLLSELKSRLTLVAQALCGTSIEILPAINEGGYKGHRFFLPERMGLFPTLELNVKYYLFRILFLSEQRRAGLNWAKGLDQGLQESRNAAQVYADEIIGKVSEEFAYFQTLYENLKETEVEPHWLYGKWMENELPEEHSQLENINDHTDTGDSGQKSISTEISSRPVEEMSSIQVDKEAQEEFMLTHNFEKIETVEEFDDIWRDFDGDDDLESDQQALSDLNLKHTVRVDDVVHSIYKADFIGQLTVAESKALKESGFYYSYPEWNTGAGKYQSDFCRVYPLLYKSQKNEYARAILQKSQTQINSLKKNLAHFFNTMARVRNVSQGELINLDKATDLFADIHAKVSPDENIYISKRKQKKDLSILFLIDLSLSGDSYVSDRKVIDIEKQAVIILGEVFSDFDIEFQIDGFFSKTRNFCTYITLKHFKDRWDQGIANVGSIAPQGFTRIGPAIRHSGYLLSKQASKARWVVLLSDGKPNDYDRYEGKYGIEDVKHALLELQSLNIQSFAIAIEEEAKYYLPRMFGI